MARKYTLIDDIDGTVAERSIEFAFDGQNYSIDLSERNIEVFKGVLSPYTQHSVKVGRRKGGISQAEKKENQKIRNWAQDHGYKVRDRGLISEEVKNAYKNRESEAL